MHSLHTIKITTNLLFEYQCTSGKFIRLPNRIEKIDSVARIESNRNFLPELECSSVIGHQASSLTREWCALPCRKSDNSVLTYPWNCRKSVLQLKFVFRRARKKVHQAHSALRYFSQLRKWERPEVCLLKNNNTCSWRKLDDVMFVMLRSIRCR